MQSHILVAGATGQTGRIIVHKLLTHDIRPGIIARDEEKSKNIFGDRVDVYIGDVRDIESLYPAMKGVHTVISAVGARTPVGKNCPKRVDYEGVSNLVQAAREGGVRRFILISSIGVTKPGHPMNCFGRVLAYKLMGEDVLRSSGLDYVIIRPGGLIDTPAGLKNLVFSQGDQISGTISRADLAETVICALEHPGEMRLTFELVSSEVEDIKNCGENLSTLKADKLSVLSLR